MKRRHLAAVVVLALVLPTVVMGMNGTWERLWMGWAYEEEAAASAGGFLVNQGKTPLWLNGIIQRGPTTGCGGQLLPEPPFPIERAHFRVMRKCRSWAPGDEFLVPSQECLSCREALHDRCYETHRAWVSVYVHDKSRVSLPDTFRCTCPHPSHAQDSE